MIQAWKVSTLIPASKRWIFIACIVTVLGTAGCDLERKLDAIVLSDISQSERIYVEGGIDLMVPLVREPNSEYLVVVSSSDHSANADLVTIRVAGQSETQGCRQCTAQLSDGMRFLLPADSDPEARLVLYAHRGGYYVELSVERVELD